MNHYLQGRNMVRKKSWMIVIGDHLCIWLLKKQKKTTTLEFAAIFNKECDFHMNNAKGTQGIQQHPSCLVPTVQPCGGSVMIWGWSSWSEKLGQLITWIYWMTRLFHQWIFSSLMVRIPRWQCQDSLGSNCERVIQGPWDIIFTYGLATTDHKPHWESLGCAGEDLM